MSTLSTSPSESAAPSPHDASPLRARRVYRLPEVPRELAEAIKSARMDGKHAPLNALLDD